MRSVWVSLRLSSLKINKSNLGICSEIFKKLCNLKDNLKKKCVLVCIFLENIIVLKNRRN